MNYQANVNKANSWLLKNAPKYVIDCLYEWRSKHDQLMKNQSTLNKLETEAYDLGFDEGEKRGFWGGIVFGVGVGMVVTFFGLLFMAFGLT